MSLAPESPVTFYEARPAQKYAASDNPVMVRLAQRVKEKAYGVMLANSVVFRLLQEVPYSGRRGYLWGDPLLLASPRCMGFGVLFVKPRQAL